MDAELSAVAWRLRRSVVRVCTRGGYGSGLVVDGDGAIVTNAHVARGRSCEIELADGSTASCDVVARWPQRDLALLRSGARGLDTAALGDARALRAGEIVIAVGNPFGLDGAVAAGVVHAPDPAGRRVVADLRLLPGNSGGPLADVHGRVVGINSMVVDGLAVAVGSGVVRRFLSAPSARPVIGIITRPVRTGRAAGHLVLELDEGAPAAQAGFVPGDLIVGAGGQAWTSPDDLGDLVDMAVPGDELHLDVVRSGATRVVRVFVADATPGSSAAA